MIRPNAHRPIRCRPCAEKARPQGVDKNCLYCDRRLRFSNRAFCGRPCATAYRYPAYSPIGRKYFKRLLTDDQIRAKSRADYQRRRLATLGDYRTFNCKYCLNEFRQTHRRQTTFCSKSCAIDFNKWNQRAIGRGATDVGERFSPFAVLDRDGYICQQCRVSTPKRMRGTKELFAPEVDHIIPCALGGAHSMRNCQCLCRKCNWEKSDQVYYCNPQLALAPIGPSHARSAP